MPAATRRALAAAACAVLASCGGSPKEPVPITPPSEVANAPVARVPVAPSSAGRASQSAASAVAPASKLDPSTFPSGAIYVCANGAPSQRAVTAIEFDPKVGSLCRRHPEMGPCQYERNICRRSGGRVYAADGSEITMATEAEYDKKVMRVRFQAK